MKHLITGAAGFIGAALSERLLSRGDEVVGADNINDYYDPALKHARLERLAAYPAFRFERSELADPHATAELFDPAKGCGGNYDTVVHLAAQAGVRYSIDEPHAYADSNLTAWLNVLQGCRHGQPERVVYASSSSVYGSRDTIGAGAGEPFAETDCVTRPASFYAATKMAGELMAHSYADLFGLDVAATRFFTVYGPWGRPDMALLKFTQAIHAGEPIPLFNAGKMHRDFTYIDDIVDGLEKLVDGVGSQGPGFREYNLGNGDPMPLGDLVSAIEKALGKPAKRNLLPMQAGDVPYTYADISKARRELGFEPKTLLDDGVARFVDWWLGYTGVSAPQRRAA
ncbi:UDP-glucose 4-epimerase [Pseudobythopirellula maris]|uniref:UDP-glucose 4-epimerase n=1 Tax=Pseudobythopirellula maris TaxID=2527991 RepID=A0A5C5ZQ97_9BACT|nr:NAD-dependent epimerase/dehydratase family protein [Pseudobythopirellula maris]TWT88991.1 UDP-glucose 4-epimerase [Pseudobythopirellula maris]